MSEPKRGRCAECDRSITLTKAGVMRDHVGDIWISGYRQQCKGVGQPPSEVLASDFDRGYRQAIADLRDDTAYAAHRRELYGEVDDAPGWVSPSAREHASIWLESRLPPEQP